MIDFIEVMDICTIFGNALNNAIEGCICVKSFSPLEKEEKRACLY